MKSIRGNPASLSLVILLLLTVSAFTWYGHFAKFLEYDLLDFLYLLGFPLIAVGLLFRNNLFRILLLLIATLDLFAALIMFVYMNGLSLQGTGKILNFDAMYWTIFLGKVIVLLFIIHTLSKNTVSVLFKESLST